MTQVWNCLLICLVSLVLAALILGVPAMYAWWHLS